MHIVLVVENNSVYLKLLDHFMTSEGFNVIAAKDGLNALNILDNHKPDIIITDIIMPKISGDQLCKIIRKSPTTQDIFLVVLSSIFIEESTAIRDLKADLCIAKGTKITLKKCIQKILTNYKNGIRYQGSVIYPEKLPSSAITQELLSARRHYETFFNHLADAVVELNPTGQIIHANHAASLLFEKDTSDLLSLHMMDLIKGPCAEEIKTWIKTVTKNTPATFKSSYQTPLSINEKLIFLHLVSVPEGGEIYVTATIMDITKRKQTEQQLNKTHSHLMLKNREIESINTLFAETLSEYEHIFENGHLGIMIFKDGRHLSRCNKRLSSLLG
ncbi:MAG: response regulator, partial [Bacteroidetes bacterium]|nr:response regulator [Bacteroidota bacterium]